MKFKLVRLIIKMCLMISAAIFVFKDITNEAILALVAIIWMNQEWPQDRE